MSPEILTLVGLAAFLGFFHTLIGPDHYVPFIMMAAARDWSRAKTALITLLCGIGHVASSIVLGFLGVGLGVIAREKVDALDSSRGDLAAWALMTFGLVYLIWGIRQAYKNKPHTHRHLHPNGSTHEHEHTHHEEHTHVHAEAKKANITPWALFVIFLLGPCEILIPILIITEMQSTMFGLALVTTTFALATIGTMLTMVLIATYGFRFLPLKRMERYSHAIAGATICICALAIHLGL
jgi:nickel/cobalt transporter (NicO) family protein